MFPTPVDPFTPLLGERVRRLFRRMPRALGGDEESIHQMRVAARRLRVALPILACRPKGRRVRRADRLLRDLTRAAGTSRDLDVSLEMLEGFLCSGPPAGPEARLIRGRLRAARAASRRRMAESLLDLEIAGMRRDLRVILSRNAESLFGILVRLRRSRDRRGARLLDEIRALGRRYDPVALHRLRGRCRRLRYTAEISATVVDNSNEAAAIFKQFQDELGRLHDGNVLADWLDRRVASARLRGREDIAREASRLSEMAMELSRRHHERYLSLDPVVSARRALLLMGRSSSVA